MATKRTYSFSYEEGHKRETRKSYQAYINQISTPDTTKDKEEDIAGDSLEIMDDSSIRRSKRTPVPKRSFKLIDDFDSKKEPPKKKIKSEETNNTNTNVEKVEKIEKVEKVVKGRKSSEKNTDVKSKIKQEEIIPDIEETEESTTRRSGRARKPKQFEDSICYTGKRKPSVTEDAKQKEQSVAEPKESPVAITKKKTEIPISPIKTTRRKSKDAYPNNAEKNKVDVTVKQEIVSDINRSNASNISEDKKQSPKKKRRTENITPPTTKEAKAKITIPDKEVQLEKQEKQEPIKLTFKTNPKPIKEMPKSPKKKKPEEKEIKEKKKDEKRSSEKLIISFKKKNSSKTKEKEKISEEKLVESLPPPIPEKSPKVEEKLQQKTEPKNDITEERSKHKHKQKKKKKKKEKADDDEINDLKPSHVEEFPLSDKNIVRVKKKKIFKKKNGEKILVRISKSHCNRNDEIVKVETFIIDQKSNTQDEIKKEQDVEPPVEQNPNEKNPILPSSTDLEQEGERNRASTPIKDQIVPDIKSKVPEANDTVGKHKDTKENRRKNIVSKKVVHKKPVIKKAVNKVIKKTTRPANKIVTVGGKVVGKTTKGMKKTGNDEVAKPKNVVKTVKDYEREYSGDISNENKKEYADPKNAYNLFCRKYRPMIVQSHPRADFSEISKRLACLWNMSTEEEKKEHRDRFNELLNVSQARMNKLERVSPCNWTEEEVEFIKKSILRDLTFNIPQHNVQNLQPVDMAAHLQLLGESLNQIGVALQQQSSMTVHGAMSVLLDSMLCALAPLLFLTSHIPEMNALDEDMQARTLDNLGYILPGL